VPLGRMLRTKRPVPIIDLADPDPQMYANFHTGSPVNLDYYFTIQDDKILSLAIE